MNQTDAKRLMFSWKKTELENIFGDEIAETTTHSVSLHDIVCGPDANTKAMHVRALSDWMKMLQLTAPSEANMRTLLEDAVVSKTAQREARSLQGIRGRCCCP
jgi:hypothetical protein